MQNTKPRVSAKYLVDKRRVGRLRLDYEAGAKFDDFFERRLSREDRQALFTHGFNGELKHLKRTPTPQILDIKFMLEAQRNGQRGSFETGMAIENILRRYL